MYLLRDAHRLARLLLACFALSLAVSMAAPFAQARPLERLCTASGAERWVAVGGNDAAAPPDDAHQLQCALCLPPMLPGAGVAPWPAPQGRPLMAAAAQVRMGHVPALSRAPFPPRAPPSPVLASQPPGERRADGAAPPSTPRAVPARRVHLH